jgi:hypothetical protein
MARSSWGVACRLCWRRRLHRTRLSWWITRALMRHSTLCVAFPRCVCWRRTKIWVFLEVGGLSLPLCPHVVGASCRLRYHRWATQRFCCVSRASQSGVDLCEGYAGDVILDVYSIVLGDESGSTGCVHVARSRVNDVACQVGCDQGLAETVAQTAADSISPRCDTARDLPVD